MNNLSLTHQRFCDIVQMFRKEKPPLSKWKSYPLYVLSLLSIGFFIAILRMSYHIQIDEYPSDKYRKIVKENWLGLKSIEYHER